MVGNNISLIENLTSEEKAQIKLIMEEISENGKSNELQDLYYADYEEIPVDIMTFLTDSRYLGIYTNNGKDIYDTWKKELQYVHNPLNFVDQWAITGSTRYW